MQQHVNMNVMIQSDLFRFWYSVFSGRFKVRMEYLIEAERSPRVEAGTACDRD
jgi:hypothetical protein